MGRASVTPRLVSLTTCDKRRMGLMKRDKGGKYSPTYPAVFLTMLLRSSNGWIKSSHAMNHRKLKPLKNAGLLTYTKIHNSGNKYTLTLTRRGTYLKHLFSGMFPAAARMDQHEEFMLTQTSFDNACLEKAYEKNERIAAETMKFLTLANDNLMGMKILGKTLMTILQPPRFSINLVLTTWSVKSRSNHPLYSQVACQRLAKYKVLKMFKSRDISTLIDSFIGDPPGRLLQVQVGKDSESVNTYFTSIKLMHQFN